MPDLDDRDLRVDILSNPEGVRVTATHIPTGLTATAFGATQYRAKKEAFHRLAGKVDGTEETS